MNVETGVLVFFVRDVKQKSSSWTGKNLFKSIKLITFYYLKKKELDRFDFGLHVTRSRGTKNACNFAKLNCVILLFEALFIKITNEES